MGQAERPNMAEQDPEGGNTVEGSQVQSGRFDFLKKFRSQEPENPQTSGSGEHVDESAAEEEPQETGYRQALNTEGRGGSEGPRNPETTEDKEWETNPERGRRLVDEVVRFRTTMTNEERYNEINGPDYAKRLQELQEFVDAIKKIRNDPDPFRPNKAYPKPDPWKPGEEFAIKPPQFSPDSEAIKELNAAINELRENYKKFQGVKKEERFAPEALPKDEEGKQLSVEDLKEIYDRTEIKEERLAAEANIDVYFRQAKNQGLLKEVDSVLNSTYKDLGRRGISGEDAETILNNGISRAKRIASIEFREKSLEDPNLPKEFANVGEVYVEWAKRRLERALHDQNQSRNREGEWCIPTQEQISKSQKETYWETGSYPKYYHISARTEEQFFIAKETFFQMIRTAAIGKSPTAIFEHVKNFIEVFGSEGGRQVREGNVRADFLNENRLELEALLYVFVANYSNEVYNPKQRKEAMMAMSLDEGPARWVAIYLSGKGGVAGFTQIFDLETLMDIYNNPVGERGELDISAGHYLQDQIQQKVIERGMGIVLKDYDWRDPFFNSGDLEGRIYAAADFERINNDLEEIKRNVKLEEGVTAFDLLEDYDKKRINDQRNNLKRLTLTQSKAEFEAIYEGFREGDAHLKNYYAYAIDQSKPEDQRQYPEFKKLPESIRKSIDLGRIQEQIRAFREAIIKGELKPGRKSAIDLLSLTDQVTYKAAFAEASANFDIAFQMQGVLAEKGRKGRGFLYVDRNDNIRYYFEVGDTLRLQKQNINEFSLEQIEKLIKTLPAEKQRSFKIGWMLAKMRDLKPLGTFPDELQKFYRALSPEEKYDFVDNLPVYQAENFVQWGAFWTKMKYADDSEVWNDRRIWNDSIAQGIKKKNRDEKRRELHNFKAQYRRAKVKQARAGLIEEIRTKGFQAKLWDDQLGTDGRRQLMRFKQPLGTIDSLTGKFRKFNNREAIGYDESGKQIILSFDNSGKPTGLKFDAQGAVIFDKEGKRVIYDSLSPNTRAWLDAETGIFIEEVEATFELAAQSDDFRNRYTDHTYWYYQGNNRDTILTPEIFEAAKRIKKGVSRWEDEDILAVQLLIVDPTLCRVKKFPDVQQSREVTLVAAAVLESFQDKQRTRHLLHRAFLPKDGYVARMRAGYRNEDWAGYDRFTMGWEEFAAQQSIRFARRLGAEIAFAPMEHDSAPARWGVNGVAGAIKVMADEIKSITHQGIVGQFGLTKIFEVLDKAVQMFKNLAGHTDEQSGENVFGLYEKPTDNNEEMHKYTKSTQNKEILADPTNTIPFMYDFLKRFGRLTKVTQLMRVMYSNVDNSQGALNLEEVDVFLDDGSFNTEIETNKKILGMNGTARNRQHAFLYGEEGLQGFYDWLVDESPGGGADVYRGERYWNGFLKRKYRKFEGEMYQTPEVEPIEDWLTEKII